MYKWSNACNWGTKVTLYVLHCINLLCWLINIGLFYLQGGFKYPPPSLYGFLNRLKKGRNFFWSPSREKTGGKGGVGGREHCKAILSCFNRDLWELNVLREKRGRGGGAGNFHFMMYCPGWEVIGAAPGERFLFRTVQRRLDGQKINFMMYCPGGEVGADLAGWNISVSYRPEAI